MGREAGPGAVPGGASKHAGKPPPPSPGAKPASRPRRASLGGGRPAQDRELRAQGRQTLQNLLEAGLAEFDERGFQAVRVDDIVRRAQISHGTFYLYFSNKEDLFKALLRDALHDMGLVTDEFPVVTRNAAGRAVLQRWVHEFCETYAAHAAVIRTLSQAEIVGEEVRGDRARRTDRGGLPDDAGAGELPADRGGQAAPRGDGRAHRRDHVRGVQPGIAAPGRRTMPSGLWACRPLAN